MGTVRPRNGACRCTSPGSGACFLPSVCHDSTLRIPPSARIRKPRSPCSLGGKPVVIDVSAAAVVDGTTDVTAVPSSARITGSSSGWRSSASHPRPSRTSTTTEVAPATGAGSQPASAAPRSEGTSVVMPGPS